MLAITLPSPGVQVHIILSRCHAGSGRHRGGGRYNHGVRGREAKGHRPWLGHLCAPQQVILPPQGSDVHPEILNQGLEVGNLCTKKLFHIPSQTLRR